MLRVVFIDRMLLYGKIFPVKETQGDIKMKKEMKAKKRIVFVSIAIIMLVALISSSAFATSTVDLKDLFEEFQKYWSVKDASDLEARFEVFLKTKNIDPDEIDNYESFIEAWIENYGDELDFEDLNLYGSSLKPKLSYKGIPLRISTQKLRDRLSKEGIVPSNEFNSKLYENNGYYTSYQFEDNVAGYSVLSGVWISQLFDKDKNSPKDELYAVVNMYRGRKDTEDTLQSVYEDLLQYLVKIYGDNYTVEENELTWSGFRNNNDVLSLSRSSDKPNIFITYIDKDQNNLIKANIALNKALGRG